MLPCPKTQEHQSTCVDSWVHRVLWKWTSAIGTRQFTMAFSLPNIVIKPYLVLNAISRRSPPVYSLALRLRNTKVPEWTHESIGYPKMDISHWDAAIHYGIQLARYCDQTRSFNAISRRSPPVYSLALRLRNTKVPVWTHESIGLWTHESIGLWTHESIGYPKWTSAIGTRQFTMAFSLPNIVIKPDLLTLFHGDRPLCTPLP